MVELIKMNNDVFKEFYVGENGGNRVVCILDDNCVRYIVSRNRSKVYKREFANSEKEKCFKNATKALNK